MDSQKRPGGIIILLVMILAAAVATGCEQNREKSEEVPQTTAVQSQQEPAAGVIVAMGDSLTAGLGVAENQAYPALLAAKLREAGLHYRVINAGISGETSRGALERASWILSFGPDIVILETGANDGLRGIDPQIVRQNIDKIVTAFRKEGVVVVLCGMEMVRNLGERYTRAFHDIYPRVADDHDVIFMPFFLEGVAGDPRLNQPDGLHPTAAGYRKVVGNLLPYVKQAIEISKKKNTP